MNALVVTEDKRFFDHQGVDYKALLRSITGIIIGRKAGGGSTITQQLAKNIYGRNPDEPLSLMRAKYREWKLAIMIEKAYNKHEIIRLYLNMVPFGDNVYGVATASKHYFDKPIEDLELHQYALLVGILKGNSLYHPRRQPSAAIDRRNTVLSLLKSNGYIDESTYVQWSKRELDVVASSPDTYPIFGYALEAIKAEAKILLGDAYNIYRDGLVIESTIDGQGSLRFYEVMTNHLHRIQQRANTNPPTPGTKARLVKELRNATNYKSLSQKEFENALTEKQSRTVINHLGESENIYGTPLDSIAFHHTLLKSAAMVIDVNTAAIRLYTGGHHARLHPYDHVHVNRQVASTFKPFIALAGLKQGVSRCDYFPNTVPDSALRLGWSPKNANLSDSGYYSLQGALTHSMNLPILHLAFQLGIERVIEEAENLGWSKPLQADPSVLLGSSENSIWEMTQLYGRIQNNALSTPYFVESISDQEGNIIYKRPAIDARDEKTPERDTLLGMLQYVSEIGTASGLKGVWAAKTGTSNRGNDNWTFGCNDSYAFGVWVGCSSQNIVTGGSSTAFAVPLAKEISSIFSGGNLEQINRHCEDYIDEKPQEKRGLFDFLKRNKTKKKTEKDKPKKNILQRLFRK